MAEDAFRPDSPESEIERRSKVLVLPHGARGMIAHVVLTNDRILFGRQLFVNLGGAGLLDRLVEGQIQKAYDKKAGGPAELFALAEIHSTRKVRRPLRGDVFEFTLEDGSTCSLGARAGKSWNSQIRRLLRERHGRTVVENGETDWRVE